MPDGIVRRVNDAAAGDDVGDTPSTSCCIKDEVDPLDSTPCYLTAGDDLVDDDVPDVIEFYDKHGLYGFLSNFYASPFTLRGSRWPTAEHYFQAMKYHDTWMEERIRTCGKPSRAKKLGCMRLDSVGITPEWDRVREKIMWEALWAKFTQCDALRAKLLSTGYAELVEHTTHDRYWGDGGNGAGLNRLGRLLEKVRRALRLLQPPCDGDGTTRALGTEDELHQWSRTAVSRNRTSAGFKARKKKHRDRRRGDMFRGVDGRSLFEADSSTGASLVSDGDIFIPMSALPPRGRDVVRRNQYTRRWETLDDDIDPEENELDMFDDDPECQVHRVEEMWVCSMCTLHNEIRAVSTSCDACGCPRNGTEEVVENVVSLKRPSPRRTLMDFIVA